MRQAFFTSNLSSSISLSPLLPKTQNRKNNSNARTPSPGVGTIGTGDPNLGVGYMGAGTQLGVAGTQIEIFDFLGPKKVLYSSRGVPWVCPGCALGVPWVCRGCALGVPWVRGHLAPDQNSRGNVFSICE